MNAIAKVILTILKIIALDNLIQKYFWDINTICEILFKQLFIFFYQNIYIYIKLDEYRSFHFSKEI